MTEQSDYREVDAALRRCGATWNAAQAHGLLCSCLAVGGAEAADEWLRLVLQGATAATECGDQLLDLFDDTQRQLAARQSDFAPLLPADEEPATDRADALACWCEGFLHGLVSGSHPRDLKARLAAEPIADIIKDLLQITRATAEDDADAETTESAYVELIEYLRVAAQLVYEELAEFRQRPAGEVPLVPGSSDNLH